MSRMLYPAIYFFQEARQRPEALIDFNELGKHLNRIFSWVMLAMTLLSIGLLLIKGVNATYFQGAHPTLPSFGYRVRTVMLYFALGYIASSRFNDFKGIPVGLSCILIQHALYELLYHVTCFSFVIARNGFANWTKDMTLYIFMLSTSVYVIDEIDSNKLLKPGRVRNFLSIGILIFLVTIPFWVWDWWPTICGLRTPFHPENIPLQGLPLKEVNKLIFFRFIHFMVKYSLFHIMVALSMSFKETE